MLQVQSVVSLFGRYIKYRTRSVLDPTVTDQTTSIALNDEAVTDSVGFEVGASSMYVPQERNCRNNKDAMYNRVVKVLYDRNLVWPYGSEALANKFLFTITEVLWYIDGHHDQLSERSTTTLSFFSQFEGYNKPELPKHRKSNLSYSVLEQHVNSLSTCL